MIFNLIKSIIQSHEPIYLLIKYLLLITIVFLVFVDLINSAKSLSDEYVYRKDFIQEYLLGKATINGVDPYLPCPELAKLFQINLPNQIHQHPTPHPPPVILLSLPFSFLSYQQAATLWLLGELFCITLAAYLLSGLFAPKCNGASHLSLTLFLSMLMLAWTPFMDELILGQLTSLLLVIFIGAWLSLRQDRDLKGGVLLGCAVAIKLIAWPVIAFLALKRRWWAVLSATALMGLANLAAAWFIGLEGIAHYYLKVGPLVSALHRTQEKNLSVWTIGWRLFEGTGSSILLGVKAPPLIHAPELARWVSLALPLAVLIIGLWLAYRARSFDFSFGILVCVSILISPVAWSVYFMLLVIPFLVGGRCLMNLAFPTRETIIVICLLLIFSVSHSSLHNYLLLFAPGQPNGNIATAPHVSWWVSMLALIPSACLLVLIYVLSQLSQKCTNGENYETRGEIS